MQVLNLTRLPRASKIRYFPVRGPRLRSPGALTSKINEIAEKPAGRGAVFARRGEHWGNQIAGSEGPDQQDAWALTEFDPMSTAKTQAEIDFENASEEGLIPGATRPRSRGTTSRSA
jgi:hypothetical protein